MFERQILSFLPHTQETLHDLQDRLYEMRHSKYYQGVPIDLKDMLVNGVINSLVKAIDRRKEEERKKRESGETYATKKEIKNSGKTKKNKLKSGYRSSVERKKAKSERDKEIRRTAQSTRGQKK